MSTFRKMLKIELRLNIRDMNMVTFAVIMPVVVLVILGIIYGGKAAAPGAGYTFMEQSFGAICAIAICAGGAMGLPIVIAEYRERKILKRFRVTPVSPLRLLTVHLIVYTIYAVVSVLLLGLIAALGFGVRIHGSWSAFLGGWLLTLISLLSIGMLVGGVAKDSKQASVIGSILYFPMLVFSGATLPYEMMPAALQKVADIMPLTQGIKLMKAAFLGQPLQNTLIPIIILATVVVVCTAAAVRFFRWE